MTRREALPQLKLSEKPHTCERQHSTREKALKSTKRSAFKIGVISRHS